MKRTLAAIASAALLFAAQAALAGKQDFTIVNKTGYTINELYVSSAKSDDWGSDVLGRDTLPSGESGDITFESGTRGCKWDLMVVYDDGEEAVWDDAFDLCSIRAITLRYDRKKGITWADTR